jgi:hypothetical protein
MVYTGPTGTEYKNKWGSKTQVWDGISYCTRGFLTRSALALNSRRKVVSKKKSEASRVRWEKQGFRKAEEMKEEMKVEERKVEDVEERKVDVKPMTAMQKKLAQLKARKRKRLRKASGPKK